MLWQEINRPIWCLAPMEGVTDSPFRQMLVKMGKPAVLFTEFASVEGMVSVGGEEVAQRLRHEESERPLVAQIWGLKPENFFKVSRQIIDTGFDGIDLNFGCPDRAVVKMGACAAMMENDRGRVKEIIVAVKEAVAGKVPVSVKTRIGFRLVETEEWGRFFLEQGIDALTIHGRTVKQMSKVSANWEEVGKVVKLRDEMGLETVIIGNGDIDDLGQAREMVGRYGVDGVMIGRGVFKNPWLFGEVDAESKTKKERLELLVEHSRLFVETWADQKNFEEMKKYFKMYIRDFDQAGEWREKLMKCRDLSGVEEVVDQLLRE